MSGVTTTSTNNIVHLVECFTPLLSGGLEDCHNATDLTCQGGVAAVSAFLRRSTNSSTSENSLVLPRIDREHPFVHMHPLGWSSNRLVFQHHLKWPVFLSRPTVLSHEMGAKMNWLITNVAVPPSNHWQRYAIPVHFDIKTGLAVLSMEASLHVHSTDPLGAAIGMLDYIADVNKESGCLSPAQSTDTNATDSTLTPAAETTTNIDDSTYTLYSFYAPGYDGNVPKRTNKKCWIPVLSYNAEPELFQEMVKALAATENPPQLIIDVANSMDGTGSQNNSIEKVPLVGQIRSGIGGNEFIWVVSYQWDEETFFDHILTLSEDGQSIQQVALNFQNLMEIPGEIRLQDQQFAADVAYLRNLADEAVENDPIVGYSEEVPKIKEGLKLLCNGGQCAIGSLGTDALRWHAQADVAFANSGGFRGDGWPRGQVKISNIWNAMPFPDFGCTGVMTGVSLFRMLNYSTSLATFDPIDTTDAGRLLQVSGVRVTYNSLLNTSRLVGLEVWDQEKRVFAPLERLRLYKFAAKEFLCDTYNPYPQLLGSDLVFEGEKAGVIGDFLWQDMVGNYLTNLSATSDNSGEGPYYYDTANQYRLVDDKTVFQSLDLVQTRDGCKIGWYWDDSKYSCFQCPARSNVAFSDPNLNFEGISGTDSHTPGRIVLVNRELFAVTVAPKSVPSWIVLTSASSSANITTAPDLLSPDINRTAETTATASLESGMSIGLDFLVFPGRLDPGRTVGTISFGVLYDGNYPGCLSQDVTFEVAADVGSQEEMNQLGGLVGLGFALMTVAVATALAFALWVLCNRGLRVVKAMQPPFLVNIFVGVIMLALSIIPLSVDDGWASTRGCDISCMATPWLFMSGFTVTFSALFSKLWRINKIFNSGTRLQRIVVAEKDVLIPFAALFALNFAFLLTWTLVEPNRWERREVDGQHWNTYGSCVFMGSIGKAMCAMTLTVNFGAMAMACYQAYKARNISDEFSESSHIAAAIFSWAQLAIVGVPVLFLISLDNTTARYALTSALIFAFCMSVLLFIFVPMFRNARRSLDDQQDRSAVRISGLSLPKTTASSGMDRSSVVNGSQVQIDSSQTHHA